MRHFARRSILPRFHAAQHNHVIKAFYNRLRAAGKPMKVGSTAAARKLLHLAWACVKKEEDFDPLHAHTQQKAA